MAVVIMGEAAMAPEMYDELNKAMNFPAEVPDGLLQHTACKDGDGMRIIDTWEAREKFEAFIENKLGPAMAKVAEDSPPEIEPIELEVHNRYPA
jgi:hypothetical protein